MERQLILGKQRPTGKYGSYGVVFGENMIHLLFNDNEKNLTIKPGMEVAEYGPTDQVNVITIATVLPNGEVDRRALLDTEMKEMAFIPGRSHSVGKNSMLIYTTLDKEHKFCTIHFR